MTTLAPGPSLNMQQQEQEVPLLQLQEQRQQKEQEKDPVFNSLCTTPLPQKELQELNAIRDSLSHEEFMNKLNTIATKLTEWLSAAHMTVFTMEQKVKGDTAAIMNTEPLEIAMEQAQPIITAFVELNNEEAADDIEPGMMMSVAKIQSEWSGLQHFASSVTKTVNALVEERQLASTMDHILLQLDDISLMIFQYHEKKLMMKPSTSSGTTVSTSTSSSTSNNTTVNKDDEILTAIDDRVEPVFREVERVYARMTSATYPPTDKSGVLGRKHAMVQERWENLRGEIDDLKYGLKEDRWLTVFKQVADQVDVMIDGLEKTTAQCYSMIQQVRDRVGGGIPKPHGSTTSVSSSSSCGSNHSNNHHAPVVIDQHKFRSAEKNFEAKYKYYTPSIDRMLAMLGNGIASRVGQDFQTTRRHQTMLQKWSHLKAEMDDLRMRDLPETERLLMADRPISPAWSRMSDRSDRSWKGYKSPEPPGMYDRARSPYSRSTLSRTGSPLYDDRQHGRSATPSSGMRSHSSIGTNNYNNNNNNNRTMSPPVVYGRHHQRTVSPLSFGSLLRPSTSDSSSVSSSSRTEDDHHHMRKKSTNRAPSESFMKPTKSSNLRKQQAANQQQQLQQQVKKREAVVRSATPNSSAHRHHQYNNSIPTRPMSSMDRVGSPTRLPVPYPDRERAMSPVRRSVTPSLIPRPKTPSRAESPTPRPRSSMALNSPSPPTATSKQQLQQSSADQQRRVLRKKQSMPAIMHRTGSPAQARLFNARTPSPQYNYHRRRDSSFSDEEYDYDDEFHYGDTNYYDDNNNNNYNNNNNNNNNGLLTPSLSWRNERQPQVQEHPAYKPDPKDPLDVEVAKIVNASPIAIKCQKGSNGSGRYYFGSELSPSVGGGKKLYTCKLMSYTGGRRRHTSVEKAAHNKVLIRVGGGWQDLELFLLHYGILH